MARIITDETSLTRKHKGVIKETGFLEKLVPFELGIAAVVIVLGLVRLIHAGSAAILVWGILLLVAGFAHRLRIRQNMQDAGKMKAGLQGEAVVTRALDRALDNTHYIFNDQVVRSGLKRAQLDHVVVSPHGIFVIETKNWRGRIVGEAAAARWHQFKDAGSKPLPVSNPIRQVQRSCRILASMLEPIRIPADAIVPMVVFRSAHTVLDVKNSPVPILHAETVARQVTAHQRAEPLSEDRVDAVLRAFMEGV